MKTTWGDIKKRVHQMMFLESDEYDEYSDAIVASTNSALKEMSRYFPLKSNYMLTQTETSEAGENEYDLYTLTSDTTNGRTFIGFADVPIQMLKDNTLENFFNYKTIADRYIRIPKSEAGSFYVNYKKYPTPVQQSTQDAYELELAPEVADLLPFYVAGHVLQDDDSQLATQYLNEYAEKLGTLTEKSGYSQGITIEGGITWL